MWILKWIVMAIVVIFLIGFAMFNTEVSASISFFDLRFTPEMPLWLIMYLSFIAGMIFWLAVSIYQVFLLKAENRRSQKKIKSLENELNRLRNVSVEDAVLTEQKASQSSQHKSGEAGE